MKVTIAEASRLTGKSVPTLHRHTSIGKLSYSKNERDEKVVDTAELERCYGKLDQTESETRDSIDQDTTFLRDNQELRHQNDILKQENDNLKSQLKEANEREQKLFVLTDRLSKQNETLMLNPPKQAPRSGNVITYFRSLFTPTQTQQDAQPTHQSEEQ